MTFTDLAPYALPVIVALAAKGVLYYSSRSSDIHYVTIGRLYFLFLLSLSVQNVAEITFFVARSEGLPTPAGGKLYFSASIMALAFLVHLVVALSLDAGERARRFISALYLYSSLLQILLWFTPYLVSGFVPFEYTYTKVPGPLYSLIETYFLGTIVGVVALLVYSAIRRSSASKKLQNQLLLFGFVPGVFIIVVVILTQHFAHHLRFNTIATLPLAMTFFLAIAWHATHQHRLVDIRFYWPWSRTKKQKTQFYAQVRQMIADLDAVDEPQRAVERLSTTLHCPIALVAERDPVLGIAGDAQQMAAIPRSALRHMDRIQVTKELIYSQPELYKVMRRHRVAAVVPFHPGSRYASGWLLLGDAFDERVYSRRDFALIIELFNKLATVFLDKLFAMRVQLAEAEARIAELEQRYASALRHIAKLEADKRALELLPPPSADLGIGAALARLPATLPTVVVVDRNKDLTTNLRELMPEVGYYADPRALRRRRGVPPNVIVCNVRDRQYTKFENVFASAITSAIALTGTQAAGLITTYLSSLSGSLIELLPVKLALAETRRRILALAQLRRACYFLDPHLEPLIGNNPALVSAIERAQELGRTAKAITIQSHDRGQSLALAHAIHRWSGRKGRVRVLNSASPMDLSPEDTLVTIGAGTPDSAITESIIAIVAPPLSGPIGSRSVHLPALAQRSDDIPLLIHYFTLQFNLKAGSSGYLPEAAQQRIAESSETVDALKRQVFVYLNSGQTLSSVAPTLASDRLKTLNEHLTEFEARIINETLVQCGGNKAKAARILGLKANTLHYKLERYGLS